MVIPPQPSTNPPSPVKPGDISKGIRLDTIDLQAILSGAAPGDLFNVAAADTADMPAVPEGYHRCIQIVNCKASTTGTLVEIAIVRLGVVYPIHTAEYYPMSADSVPADTEGISAAHAKSFIMKPGDILRGYDTQVAGATITLSGMYKDVFI